MPLHGTAPPERVPVTMTIEKAAVDSGPPPRGPYTAAITANGFVFVSGQLPVDHSTGEMVAGDIEEQTERVLKNLDLVLTDAGSNLAKLVKTTVYLLSRSDWAAMNNVYSRFAGEVPPARTAVIVPEMAPGARIEIDAIAHL